MSVQIVGDKPLPKKLRILIVEDSEEDFLLILRHLRQAGFDVTHSRVETATEMNTALDNHSWDLIISDYFLPKFGGIDALETTKQYGLSVPFIIVSGVIGEETAIAAMKAGAHDYVSKVNLDRLIPAVKRELKDAVTRRKRIEAEEALRKSELRFKQIVENFPFPIGIINQESNTFEYINPGFSQTLGYPFEEIQHLGDWLQKVFPDPSQRDLVINAWQASVKKLKQKYPVLPQAFDMTCKNGYQITVLFHILTLEGPKIYLLFEDITEVKQAEKRLQRLYDETVALSKMKSDLITFASHELKTPLVPILGWAEFIKNALEGGKPIEKLISLEEITSMFNSATRLHQIITNFLDVQRIEADKFDLKLIPHSITQILSKAITNLQGAAATQNIQFVQEFEEIELEVDGFRIEQVFTNILSNAIKYSNPNSSVTISSTQSEGFFRIIVTDKGIGFTREEVRDAGMLFSPSGMQRKEIDPTTGAGVGLYLAKTILARHGGRLDIFSEGRNKGATIQISLPLHKVSTENLAAL